jgi:hypothetical protein
MQDAIPAPKKAQKSSVKLKMAIQGPSGSGKTEGALALAKNFVPNGKVLLIDTENESASLYANRYEFDTIPLSAPYTSARYRQAMQYAVDGGYDVLIVDSLTQQWDGDGGILRRKEEKDRSGGNSFTNWASFTPEHTSFVEFIKQLPVHTIVTMRSKQAYVLEKNDRGKETPRKVGLEAVQREGLEYELTIVFEVGMGHRATTSKNRTTLFQDNEPIDLTSTEVATSIREWLADGKEPEAPRPMLVDKAPVFKYEAPNLLCEPIDVEQRTTKGKDKRDFLAVKLNGFCEGNQIAFCWHKSLFDALKLCMGKSCQLEVELSGDYLNITNVLAVGDQEYRDGLPYPPAQQNIHGLEVTDDDIPF